MSSFLTRQEIVESAGTEQLDDTTELEILFNGFNEIAALEFCPQLRRLTLIDNGLKRISNLHPVSNTLVSLCLCDQALTAMENLALPQLRELFLHRNQIRRIGNLSGCPKLKKLWLCQNAVEQVTGLHAVPELEECWLQSNQIKKLSGFEHSSRLQSLGLAGNPVSDLKEVKRLAVCNALRMVSFSDIHFGRCPVTDEGGYKEFITLHLGQVHVLDGIVISKDAQITAEELYFAQVKSFNQSLVEVEEAYQRDLAVIEAQHQARESYSNVLEKEMASALRELQDLVSESRNSISKQKQRQTQLISSSSATIVSALEELESNAKVALRENLDVLRNEFDSCSSMLSILEQVIAADKDITNLLCAISNTSKSGSHLSQQETSSRIKHPSVVFQCISSNTADFQLLASLLQGREASAGVDVGRIKRKNGTKSAISAVTSESQLELARLYRIATEHISNCPMRSDGLGTTGDWGFPRSPHGTLIGGDNPSDGYERVFTVLTPEMVEMLLLKGWEALPPVTMLASGNADLMCSLYSSVGMTMPSASPSASADYWKVLQKLEPGEQQEQTLHRLQSALTSQLFLVLCCKLHTGCVTFHQSVAGGEETANHHNEPLTVQLPSNSELKTKFMNELQHASMPRKLYIVDGDNSSHMTYLLPPSVCASCLSVDFMALCVQQPANNISVDSSNGWLRSAEYRLEPLLMPSTNVDHTAHILATYENKAAEEVTKYMDRLLEEVSDHRATSLMQVEHDVAAGERSLKGMRDEIEHERRQQDALLREMRQNADGAVASSASTGSGAGANPHLINHGLGRVQRNSSKR